MARSTACRRAARGVDLRVEALDDRLLLTASSLPAVTPTYPADPQFSQQWGLNNPSDIDVDAPEAWAVTTGSPSTIVAIVDSGVDLRNPDLVGRLWVNPSASRRGKTVYGWNFVNNNGNVQDQFGHGTHVAGVIAAAADNRKGIVGIDWNAKIMPLKTLAADGSGSLADAAAAIRFAVDHGARVINASWGSDVPDDALYDAIAYADRKGVVLVTAAGNEGANSDVVPSYPASYDLPNILVVAAIDPSGGLASFSNYGLHSVDLAAPGVSIYSTYPPRTYGLLSGTSMAVPYVTGVVSLLVGLHPDWSAEQLVRQVLATVKPLPGLAGKTVTGGIVDAAQALGVSGSGLTGDRYISPPATSRKVAVRSTPIRRPAPRAQSWAASSSMRHGSWAMMRSPAAYGAAIHPSGRRWGLSKIS